MFNPRISIGRKRLLDSVVRSVSCWLFEQRTSAKAPSVGFAAPSQVAGRQTEPVFGLKSQPTPAIVQTQALNIDDANSPEICTNSFPGGHPNDDNQAAFDGRLNCDSEPR